METKFKTGDKVIVKYGEIRVIPKNYGEELKKGFNSQYNQMFGKNIVDELQENDLPVNFIEETEEGYIIDDSPKEKGLMGIISSISSKDWGVFYTIEGGNSYREDCLELIS